MTHIAHQIKLFLQKIEEYRVIRITEKELYKLSDRELNDIGICRGDIYSLVRGDKTLKRTNNFTFKAPINSNLRGWI